LLDLVEHLVPVELGHRFVRRGRLDEFQQRPLFDHEPVTHSAPSLRPPPIRNQGPGCAVEAVEAVEAAAGIDQLGKLRIVDPMPAASEIWAAAGG
jgi:hypothetical protein